MLKCAVAWRGATWQENKNKKSRPARVVKNQTPEKIVSKNQSSDNALSRPPSPALLSVVSALATNPNPLELRSQKSRTTHYVSTPKMDSTLCPSAHGSGSPFSAVLAHVAFVRARKRRDIATKRDKTRQITTFFHRPPPLCPDPCVSASIRGNKSVLPFLSAFIRVHPRLDFPAFRCLSAPWKLGVGC